MPEPLPCRAGYEVPALVLDVETRGLHGEAFAVGWVYVVHGQVVDSDRLWCPPDAACGDDDGLRWAREHVVPQLRAAGNPTHDRPRQIREEFWRFWELHRTPGVMVADWGWPAETNFLSACVADDPAARMWSGPMPLLDAGTLREVGLAMPARDLHDPLADAIETWLSMRRPEEG